MTMANPLAFLRAPLLLAWRDGHLALDADAAKFDSLPRTVSAPTLDALPDAVAGLLAPHRGRRVWLRVGDEHARLLHLPRPRGARSPAEIEAALRQRAAQLHGDAGGGAGWAWRWTAAPGARADTACALPVALVAALRAACRKAGVHGTSLQSDWIASAAQSPRRGRLWVLNAGARTLTLGLLDRGHCEGVRRLAPPGPEDDLADVMARAQPLFAARPEDALAPVWLFGAPLTVPLGAAAARVRHVEVDDVATLAHSRESRHARWTGGLR